MRQRKEIIYYERYGSKVHWKYKSSMECDFEIIKLEDVWKEESYCYGIEQYIKSFAECIKDKVIRYLPNLNEIQITFGVFDKNIWLHQFTISAIELLAKILNKKIKKENYYKSIFIEIKYQGKVAFLGALDFNGLI